MHFTASYSTKVNWFLDTENSMAGTCLGVRDGIEGLCHSCDGRFLDISGRGSIIVSGFHKVTHDVDKYICTSPVSWTSVCVENKIFRLGIAQRDTDRWDLYCRCHRCWHLSNSLFLFFQNRDCIRVPLTISLPSSFLHCPWLSSSRLPHGSHTRT